MQYELSSCPFCLSDTLELILDENDNHVVLCNDCRTLGPVGNNKEAAANLWNDRN